MSDLFQDFVRKSWPVQAVQVTLLNINELADACGGEVKHDGDKENHFSRDYIKVPVRNPINDRQTKAHVGDWLVKQGSTFKVYPDVGFRSQFELKSGGAVPGGHPKPASKPYKGKNKKKGPTPAQMPKKRTEGPIEKDIPAQGDKLVGQDFAGVTSVQIPDEPRVITDARIVSASFVENTPENRAAGAHPVEFIGVTKDSQKLSDFVKEDKEPEVVPELARLNEDIPQSDGEKPVQLQRPQLGDQELADRGLPQSIHEEYKPLYTDGHDYEVNAEVDRRVKELSDKAYRDGVEAQKKLQEDLDQAEVDANVEAQLAQVSVEDLGGLEEPVKKPITLDELNAMPGDDRTTQDIYREAQQRLS